MTIAASTTNGSASAGSHLPDLMAPRAPQPDGCLVWPYGLRGDLVDAPLEACCGAFAHLARAGVTACPVVQLGGRMLFLTTEGSAAASTGWDDGLPPGVTVHSRADNFPAEHRVGNVSGCWVVGPTSAGQELPSAEEVLSALRSAYAEYQAAKAMK